MVALPEVHGLAELQRLFAEKIEPGQEPVLFSFDIEGLRHITGERDWVDANFGAVTLDTRDCHEAYQKGEPLSSFSSISIHANTPSTFREKSSRVMFGPYKHINKRDAKAEVGNVLARYPGRRIIYLGHGVREDLLCLLALGIDLSIFHRIFDTYLIYHLDLKMGSPCLGGLVRALGQVVEPWQFHIGSNDAAFALRAFLKLVLDSVLNFQSRSMQKALLHFFHNGFHVDNNPPYQVANHTTDASRRVEPERQRIDNLGRWPGHFQEWLTEFRHKERPRAASDPQPSVADAPAQRARAATAPPRRGVVLAQGRMGKFSIKTPIIPQGAMGQFSIKA